jgi:hypothetical protein
MTIRVQIRSRASRAVSRRLQSPKSAADVNPQSAADVNHRTGGFEESRLTDVVAGLLAQDCLDDVSAEILIARAGAEAAIEVVLDLREQAGANFAVGCEPHPAACAAKGLADRRDNSDFTNAVCKCIAPSGFARFPRRKFDERKRAADAVDNFAERDDDLGGPEAALFKWHELDEADDDIFLAGESGKAFDLVVIEAAQEHAVDFEGREAGSAGGANTSENLGKAAFDAGNSLECSGVDGVHADCHAVEAGVLERLCKRLEQVAVGGEREVKGITRQGAEAREVANQVDQAAAQERLAAGKADFGDAQPNKQLDEPEVLIDGQLGILRADFTGAAVDAFVVAAVGDGDAQVVNHPAMAIRKRRMRRRCGDCGEGSGSHRQLQAYTFFAGA